MEMEPKDTSFEVFSHIKKHYYGDTVRRFFFTGDVIMLLTLAFFRDRAIDFCDGFNWFFGGFY
uniref:Uncharacterized protein n=1 Tax=Candidatus Giovannonibacteria bacterium GW2011_GWF2_42_19 TaxID=1618659 RepID=A0A0G1CG07_9BACT|nr:MAG: hypothetical protein UV11_C0008G0047 [Candidatus Giovannonibacteria bacterium GW2011_GWF2_42_19]